MKNFLKVLVGAWITGAVLGAGCAVGAVATKMLVPRGKAEARWAQAQVAEMQEMLDRIERDMIYDGIAARGGFDEMAGLE